ncbi:hypothetical protein AHF37_03829 [Paragonimus kellicotti]|nr:hypothetical protein AHF37_03829 [Paragonimus kellicotti]
MGHYYDVSEKNDSSSVISPLSMSASEESLLFHDYQSAADIQHLENKVLRRVRYHFGELLEIILDKFVTLADVKEIFMFLCGSSSINVYEPGTAINLYTFMLRPLGNMGSQAKKNALQLVCKLITNTRISDAHKVQILLEPLGGLTGFLAHHEELLPLLQDADCVGLFLQIFKTIRGRDLPGLLKFIELLRHTTNVNYTFIMPYFWLVQRLLEHITESVQSELGDVLNRLSITGNTETVRQFCFPLIRLVVDVTCNHPRHVDDDYRVENQSEATKPLVHETPKFSSSNVLELSSSTNFSPSTTEPVSTPETKTTIRFSLESDDDPPISPILVSSMIAQTSATTCTPLFSPQTSPTLCNQSLTDETHCIRLADLVLRVLHQLLWQGCGLNKWFSLFAVREESPWVVNRLSITGNTETVRQFCFPLIRLVVDVTCNHPRHVDDDYRVELLDAVTNLTQEILIVWDLVKSWEEMEAVLLHMLFVWIFEGSNSTFTKIVPTVFSRLRYMVYQLKNRIVFRKAAFILYRLNKNFNLLDSNGRIGICRKLEPQIIS